MKLGLQCKHPIVCTHMWYSNWCPLFVQDEESEEVSDWDRYAAEQYEMLLAEEAYEQNG